MKNISSLIEFDNSKDIITEAMLMTEEEIDVFNKKCSFVTKSIILDEFSTVQVAEKILNEFTPKELLMSSVFYVLKTTEEIVDSPMGSFVVTLTNAMKDLKKTVAKEENESTKEE